MDSRLPDRRQFALRRRFGWKYADFVIGAPYTLNVLALVELDDRTHDAGRDRQRHAITRAAGYRTLRFQSNNKPTVAELADLFAKLLPARQSFVNRVELRNRRLVKRVACTAFRAATNPRRPAVRRRS